MLLKIFIFYLFETILNSREQIWQAEWKGQQHKVKGIIFFYLMALFLFFLNQGTHVFILH